MTGKRSNSSNERSDNSKNGSKGRLNKASKGHFGSKGSLLSKPDGDLDGEYELVSSKLYPKENHQNTTLQIIKKGKLKSISANFITIYIETLLYTHVFHMNIFHVKCQIILIDGVDL